MAEVVGILTTCWRLVRAINEVVARIEPTREDARVLTVSVGLPKVWEKQVSHDGCTVSGEPGEIVS